MPEPTEVQGVSATKLVPTPPPAVDAVSDTVAVPEPARTPGGSPRNGTGRLAPLAPGERMGPFKIVSHLGRGGMGDVYRAHDESLDRDVALKTITPALTLDAEFVQRFQTEAKSAARVVHANVVQVYSWGEDRGTGYFAMELVSGRSVGDVLRERGAIDWREAVRIAVQVARGLEAAHSHGVIHRDVKPENILLAADGTAKVADFGLAKRVADAGTTASGVIVGTPRYMSPEQAQGETLDERSDMYSLGATLFHMVAGKPVFDGSSPMKVCMRHIQEPPPDVSTLVANVPAALPRVVARLLAKRREDRPPSYAQLVRELESVLEAADTTKVSPVLATAAKAPLLQVVRRPDGAVEVDLKCPITTHVVSETFRDARSKAPLAPRWRRFVADMVDLGHLWLAFGVLVLVPLFGRWTPFAETVVAITITYLAVQYLTRRGGTIGERFMDVRLVARAGGLPPHTAIGMGWTFAKAFPLAIWIVFLAWDKVFPALGGEPLRVYGACGLLATGTLLEYGTMLATGVSFRDRVFKTRVIDVRGLPPEDDWL